MSETELQALWTRVEEIAAEVESRLPASPRSPQRVEHRLQVAKLQQAFWRVFK
ncbi:MAG: hypothetical protein ABI566_04575 [Pseudolysinimonas sp.]